MYDICMISDIAQGKAWTDISSKYNISKRIRSIRAEKIRSWIDEGLSNQSMVDKLQAEFDMPDRKKAEQCVIDTKSYYKRILQSSTARSNTNPLEKDHGTSKEIVPPKANVGSVDEKKLK